MYKDTTVTQIHADLHLNDVQKYDNYLATQPAEMFNNPEGIYSKRTDVALNLGWLMVPCLECGKQVRTTISVDEEGEAPIAHRDHNGAYYEDDLVTCAECYLDTRYIPTGKVAA